MKVLHIPSVFGSSVEIAYQKIEEAYEVWISAVVKGERTLFEHFLNESNPADILAYSELGGNSWIDVDYEIPVAVYEYIEEDMEDVLDLRESADFLRFAYDIPLERSVWNKAKKNLVGVWASDRTSFQLCEDGKFVYGKSGDNSNIKFAENCEEWEAEPWMLLLRTKEGQGNSVGIYFCDGNELHLTSFDTSFLVEVFKRKE